MNDPFTEKQMHEAWKEVMVLVKKKGKSNLGVILGVHLPILNDNFEIELPIIIIKTTKATAPKIPSSSQS